MNRRNFFKVVTGFVAGVLIPKAKAKDKLMCGGQNGTLCPRCKFNYKTRLEFNSGELSSELQSQIDAGKDRWRFYINGKEIDSSRAVDKSGCLHWPFKGAKHGEICTAQTPTIIMI